MGRVELHCGATTDTGHVREVNQDAFLARPPLFVVADGMGGHHGGDVASRIVVEEFEGLAGSDWDPDTGAAAIADTLRASQRRILEYAERQGVGDARAWYAGTTAVIAMLVADPDGPHWLLANLGDSRAYRLVHGELEQISVDHSVVQELVASGRLAVEDIASHPDRHVITRALGGPDAPDPDYFLLPLAAVDRLLLCSDGVNGMLTDDALAEILRITADPGEAAERVVAAALDAGGLDNATAVVVDVVGYDRGDALGTAPHQVSLEEKLGARP